MERGPLLLAAAIVAAAIVVGAVLVEGALDRGTSELERVGRSLAVLETALKEVGGAPQRAAPARPGRAGPADPRTGAGGLPRRRRPRVQAPAAPPTPRRARSPRGCRGRPPAGPLLGDARPPLREPARPRPREARELRAAARARRGALRTRPRFGPRAPAGRGGSARGAAARHHRDAHLLREWKAPRRRAAVRSVPGNDRPGARDRLTARAAKRTRSEPKANAVNLG